MRILFALFFLLLLSAGCGNKKDNTAPEKKIQVEIHINHNYRNYGDKGVYLGALYNRVIAAPVTFKVQLSRTDGKPDTVITATIPAGHKNLVHSDPSEQGIMNLFEKYIGEGYKEGLKILSIECEDKQFSFSTDPDPVNHLDFITVTDFKSNGDTIHYQGFSDFTGMDYLQSNKSYAFSTNKELRVISETGQPALYVGLQIKMPYCRYYYKGDHGTELNNMEQIAEGSGSTVVFTITRVGDKSFDAIFSGKVWSRKEPDTLVIREGILMNAKLPRVQ
ncbi:MAG: hypothetical protein J7623_29730 [Chitinophaga sp.]|uniref:hypothetical protein n=1 Tax=Chitinophaga sp. TaxID=1869181 RepID=UPI001B2BD1B6|nr:hypothetical protein [Chitinophaga sp.]MBO9732861.1 hypothetical protein [Chitinophaga sp.]